MRKLLISTFGASLALFAAMAVDGTRANAAETALVANHCALRSGNWFCFYHNGVAYYTQCSAEYGKTMTCNGRTSEAETEPVQKEESSSTQ